MQRPLYLLMWKIAPALAMGNTAVCKPSELTPQTAYLLGDVLTEAGIPPGVCNIVFGRGAQAGRALVQHPDVPLISFTGGTQTARGLIEDAAPFYKKLGLELGYRCELPMPSSKYFPTPEIAISPCTNHV